MLRFIGGRFGALVFRRKRDFRPSTDRKGGKERIAARNYARCMIAVLCALVACSEDTVETVAPTPSTPAAVPYISYFNETRRDLCCAAKINGSWNHNHTPVSYNATDQTGYTSLALDAQGNPHISYYEYSIVHVSSASFDTLRAQCYLNYAKKTGDGWKVEVIEQTVEYKGEPCVELPILSTSLSLDAQGTPHIGYFECDVDWIPSFPLPGNILSNGYLKYAKKTGGGWETEMIDQTHSIERSGVYLCFDTGCGCFGSVELPKSGNSLALDAQGNPHMSYYDASNGDLKYTVKRNGAWENGVVDSGGDVGVYSSLAIGTQGDLHISYYDASSGNLKYAVKSGGGWENGIVESGGDVGGYSSLALDAQGNPHISYYDASNGDLRYAIEIDGFWFIEPVDRLVDSGRGVSLALDAEGNPHIGYFEASNGDLKYAVKSDGGWTIELVDCWGTTGVYPSLALGSQ